MDQFIGLKIRKVRELKDFSQGFVADKLLVSQSTYSDIENGKQLVSKEKLEKIAEVLGVTTEMLENFSDQVVFNSCSQSGVSNTYHITNPIEKINELYEELIGRCNGAILSKMIVDHIAYFVLCGVHFLYLFFKSILS